MKVDGRWAEKFKNQNDCLRIGTCVRTTVGTWQHVYKECFASDDQLQKEFESTKYAQRRENRKVYSYVNHHQMLEDLMAQDEADLDLDETSA